MKKRNVTIIGAGIAGVMAARTLQRKGVEDIHVIEKSKSVGGRLATQQIDEDKVDHGAQFFTVRSNTLQDYVEKWLEHGWIKHWFGDPYPRYTSVSGMNHLVKQLAEGLPITLQSQVEEIKEVSDGFQVTIGEGETFKTNALLITTPVPETVSLLKSKSITLPEDRLKELADIQFQSALVGMFAMNKSPRLPSNGHIDEGLPEGVERIVDHQKKGISKSPIVSVYMNADWSDRYFHQQDGLTLLTIKESVKDYLDSVNIKKEQLKKWRYAQARSVIHKPYLQVHEGLPLYVAGDAFLRPGDKAGRTRFESAFLSGIEAGESLSSKLRRI